MLPGMSRDQRQPALIEVRNDGDEAVAVNERCALRTREGHRVVTVSGVVLAQYAVGDRMAEAHAMVSLVEQGQADQNDVARAFGCSTRTLRRQEQRMQEGGLAALVRAEGYPKGRARIGMSRTKRVERWKREGIGNREIARRLGVDEKSVRKLLRRMGWTEARAEQAAFSLEEPTADPNLSAFRTRARKRLSERTLGSGGADPNLSAFSTAEEPSFSMDADPSNRKHDRLLAYLGVIEDAVPIFRDGERVPGAGVLVALPALMASGIFEAAREVYGSIGPAFYGLRTTMLAMLLMALLRIKRAENLKEHIPDDLGRVLGLDRAPEVKTLRRKLSRFAGLGRAVPFGRELARRRVAARGEAMGFLYVDGHVRVYHGKRTIPKTHVARMRISMPATSDYWVNDATGDPLFVVTAEAHPGLATMLPVVLAEARALVGERRVTVVFDRGGWSPRLFAKLIVEGFDIMTYRKGRVRRVPKAEFHERKVRIDGRTITYMLADQGVLLLNRTLRLRQVTRLSENGHQTQIITSRRDLSAIEVAYRMFTRWRQENFFKYMREEYLLDALVDYGIETADPEREVPNPEWNRLDAEIHKARADTERLAAHVGHEALDNLETQHRTMRGFKIANARVSGDVIAALRHLTDLRRRRDAVPKRVSAQQAAGGAEVIRLATERKHLTNLIKMVAYQAEGDLVRLLAPHYRRTEDEGRTLIQSALAAPADIAVRDRELRVTLHPMSSAHRTRAVAALCHDLNEADVRFPGTALRLRLAIGTPR